MRLNYLIPIITLLLLSPSAFAVRIADITRMSGERQNVLTGTGLVIGLHGTGDGCSCKPAAEAIKTLMVKSGYPTDGLEIGNGSNVAIVSVVVYLPGDGARRGDHLDARVMSHGAATCLKGGVLYLAPVMGPDGKPFSAMGAAGNPSGPIPFATANGPVVIEDATNPTSGIVKEGAVMEVDLAANVVDEKGHFTLIINPNESSWLAATTIARLINESDDSGERLAEAVDAREVRVQLPATERVHPADFIASVLTLQVPVTALEARPEAAQAPIVAKTSGVTTAVAAAGSFKIDPIAVSLGWVGVCLLLNGWLGSKGAKHRPAVIVN